MRKSVVINIFFWLYSYYIKGLALKFRTIFLGWLEDRYERFLRFALRGWRAFAFLFGTIALLFLTIIIVGIAGPKIEFFPDNQPNQIIVYAEYPQGTDIEKTNSITKKLENDFICLKAKNSTHILNAISPAFTSSFSLADLIIDKYLLKNL